MKKVISEGYLVGISELYGDGEMSQEEFDELMERKPSGSYRYNVNTEAWEPFTPPVPAAAPVTLEDIATALEEIL